MTEPACPKCMCPDTSDSEHTCSKGMQTYEVCAESRVSHQFRVRARSPEDAARKAIEQCGQKFTMQVKLDPVYLEESRRAEEQGELSIRIDGACVDCGIGLTNRKIEGQPWNYASVDEQGGMVCFLCGRRRKEAGRYCKRYLSLIPCSGCETCPKEHANGAHVSWRAPLETRVRTPPQSSGA